MVQFLICPSHSHSIFFPWWWPAAADGGSGNRGRRRRPPCTAVDGVAGNRVRRRRAAAAGGLVVFVGRAFLSFSFHIYFTFPPLPFYTKHFQYLPTLHSLNYFSFPSQSFHCKTLSFTYPITYQTDPKRFKFDGIKYQSIHLNRTTDHLIIYFPIKYLYFWPFEYHQIPYLEWK